MGVLQPPVPAQTKGIGSLIFYLVGHLQAQGTEDRLWREGITQQLFYLAKISLLVPPAFSSLTISWGSLTFLTNWDRNCLSKKELEWDRWHHLLPTLCSLQGFLATECVSGKKLGDIIYTTRFVCFPEVYRK